VFKKNIFALIVVATLASCSQIKVWDQYLPKNDQRKTEFFHAVWAKNLDPISNSGNLPISLSGAAIDDGIVYMGSNQGYFAAYELANGREVWRAADGSTYHSAPIIYKDKVIYGTVEGRVIARNTKNGSDVYYNVDLGASVETAGTVHNGKIIFHLRNHQVFCLDIKTGKILWGFKKSISYLTTLQKASKPIVYNNKVFVGFADGTLGVLGLDEGLLLYEVKISTASKFLDVDANPFIFEDKLYIGSQSGPVMMIDPNSGKIIRTAEFSSLRAPIVVNKKLVFGTTSGEVVMTDLNLVVQKKMVLSKAQMTSITIFKNKIIVGNLKGKLFAVDFDLSSINAEFDFGHAYSAIFSDFDSREDHLVVTSSRNRVFVFN
jgi:outer membrane protein assembly factor BamB